MDQADWSDARVDSALRAIYATAASAQRFFSWTQFCYNFRCLSFDNDAFPLFSGFTRKQFLEKEPLPFKDQKRRRSK